MKPSLNKERRNWLASLVDGMEVASITERGDTRIVTVTSEEKGFIGSDKRTYSLTGRAERRNFGADTQERFLVPLTDEIRIAVEIQQYRERISHPNFGRNLSDAQVLAIAQILKGGK